MDERTGHVVRLPRGAADAIAAHAVEALPEECCGFLLGRREGDARDVAEARRARNVAPSDRSVRYVIDPAETLRAEREGRQDRRILGFYHSHPGFPSVPSDRDLRDAWPWYVYVILEVRDRSPGPLRAWALDEASRAFRAVPLLLGDGARTRNL